MGRRLTGSYVPQGALSALAHWCPLFAEAPFLPALAYPFVRALGTDACLCFEALASLLRCFAGGWFELFPDPPVALLRRLVVGRGSSGPLHPVSGWVVLNRRGCGVHRLKGRQRVSTLRTPGLCD